MKKQHDSNVVLLPKTVEYYQFELTKLLETEKYYEAKTLLRFLIDCSGKDDKTDEEWLMLLRWLEEQFPGYNDTSIAEIEDSESTQEEELTEKELLKQSLRQRHAVDQQIVKKLLKELRDNSSFEKKWIALEQLAYIEHKDINSTLKKLLQEEKLHPMLQFKILQTLKLRNARGSVQFLRMGEQVDVKIADVPQSLDQFPERLQNILEKVKETCEIYHPSLAYFAEQNWKEFLSCIYGSSLYEELLETSDCSRIWASVLHFFSLQTMGNDGMIEETTQLYEINSSSEGEEWLRAYTFMKECLQSSYRFHH